MCKNPNLQAINHSGNLQVEEFHLVSSSGRKLFAKSWSPSQPRAVICLVHGLGEHCGRYQHVGEHFTQQGFALFAYDQQGHGRSPGRRGHARQKQLWDDVETIMKQARSENLDIPMFLYGHSMGGNVVCNFLLRRNVAELRGAVITSPWLELSFQPPAWQVKLGRFMSKIWPSLTQPNSLDVSQLSRDPKVGEQYQQDPLVHDRISAALFVGTQESGAFALQNAANLKLPALIMHGTDDQITSADASTRFAGSSDMIQLKLWTDYRHETHNEYGKEEVLKFITDWISSQLP